MPLTRKPPFEGATRWKPPKAPAVARPKGANPAIDLTVFQLPGAGPEDVAVDPQGFAWVGLADGRIVRVNPDGGDPAVIGETGGRPLGIEIYADGDLLICDAHRGVLRMDRDSGSTHSLVDEIGGKPMKFCNNASIAADGTVYFTDSSLHFGIEHVRGEVLAHTGTGRVFRRSTDGEIDLIADGLQFGNGVALAADESYLIVAQTSEYRLDRIWLTGPKAGQREPFALNLPGFPDNLSLGSDGLIWVALASPRDPMLDLVLPLSPLIRKGVWMLPDAIQPKEKKSVWVQAYDGDGGLVHDLRTKHPQLFITTGVCERDGQVWIGSVEAAAIGRINLR